MTLTQPRAGGVELKRPAGALDERRAKKSKVEDRDGSDEDEDDDEDDKDEDEEMGDDEDDDGASDDDDGGGSSASQLLWLTVEEQEETLDVDYSNGYDISLNGVTCNVDGGDTLEELMQELTENMGFTIVPGSVYCTGDPKARDMTVEEAVDLSIEDFDNDPDIHAKETEFTVRFKTAGSYTGRLCGGWADAKDVSRSTCGSTTGTTGVIAA
jgi:hypothetical protein